MLLQDYVRAIRRAWWLVALVASLGAATAAVTVTVLPPRYVATAELYVVVRTEGDTTTGALVQSSTAAQQKALSYVDLASTSRVLEPVVRELELDDDPQMLAETLSAEVPDDSALFRLSASSRDPAQAARIAGAVAASLTAVVDALENGTDDDRVRVELVQEPRPPAAPESPRPVVDIALGLLLGLMAGVGLAVLRSQLDTGVHNAEVAEATLRAPVLAKVAYDKGIVRRPLIVHDDPHDPRAEAFRTLRTNLRYATVDEPSRCLVVTSAGQSEGKTSVACNLALALADEGARVALVDADLRRPAVAERMGIEGAVGLTDILIGRVELADVLQPWGRSPLSVLPSGAVPPNPSEMLGSQGMATLLAELEAHFDYVVIDAPPLLPVTDAAVLAPLASGCLLVASARGATTTSLHEARAVLDRVQGRILGAVLTMMPTSGPDGQTLHAYRYEQASSTSGASRAR